MSMTLRVPYEKAMALGGVATGSMKAKEALMVQGSMTYRGWTSIVVAWGTNHGQFCRYMEYIFEGFSSGFGCSG